MAPAKNSSGGIVESGDEGGGDAVEDHRIADEVQRIFKIKKRL